MTSMYSINVDGKVLDFKFIKLPIDGSTIYTFHIGHIYIGQIHKMVQRSVTSWVAISALPSNGLCPIYGFVTRHRAADFLLKLQGYTPNG